MTETHVFYAPGDWTLLARNGHYLLVDTSPADGAVGRLWEALEATTTATAVLDALARELPHAAFCLVDGSADDLAVAQQGIVAALDGHPVQAGATPSTVAVPGSGGMVIAAAGPGAATLQIPIESGVVSAGALIVVQVGTESDPPAAHAVPEDPATTLPATDLGSSASTRLWDDVPPFEQETEDFAVVDLAPPVTAPPVTAAPVTAAPVDLASAAPPAADAAPSHDAPPVPYPYDPSGPIMAPPPPLPPETDPDATVHRTDLARAAGTVLAAICLDGHLSSANAPTCRVCDAPMPPQTARPVEQPSLGSLVLPDGATVELDRGAILGRAPRVPDDATAAPHLVNLAQYGRDVSRQHAEVIVREWAVTVRDLGSANGTRVHSPTGEVTVLEPGTEVELVPGSLIDIAEVASVAYRTAH